MRTSAIGTLFVTSMKTICDLENQEKMVHRRLNGEINVVCCVGSRSAERERGGGGGARATAPGPAITIRSESYR